MTGASGTGALSAQDPVLQALCGKENLQSGASKGSVICSTCPKLDREVGGPGEALVVAREMGSFTAAGKREVLVTLSGCEAHYLNFGGTFLLEENVSQRGVWQKKAYFEGFVPSRCRVVSRPGKRALSDAIFCETTFAGGGKRLNRIQSLVYDPKSSRLVDRTLLEFGDNLGMGVYPDRKVFSVESLGWGVETRKDSQARLQLKLRLRHGEIPADKVHDIVDAPESYIQQTEELSVAWAGALAGVPPKLLPEASSKAAIARVQSLLRSAEGTSQ